MLYAIAAIFLAYVSKKDLEFSAWIIPLLMLIVVFAVSVDEIWGIFEVLHPVVILALAGIVVFFFGLAGHPIGFSMPYLVIFQRNPHADFSGIWKENFTRIFRDEGKINKRD
ncbi:hypothetical protein CTI12_AA035620 [Artemisia annua]|uniref:Uncharacterized protein n=1 Tax=Artemisia annua TaxID=35608 RepID=A0A2U1PNP4_ARTAN|nr:hypothetical protein CTI12_AA035620 [Artemisia annua]